MAIDWNNIKNDLDEITKKEITEQKKETKTSEKDPLPNTEKKPFTKMVFAKSKKDKKK